MSAPERAYGLDAEDALWRRACHVLRGDDGLVDHARLGYLMSYLARTEPGVLGEAVERTETYYRDQPFG